MTHYEISPSGAKDVSDESDDKRAAHAHFDARDVRAGRLDDMTVRQAVEVGR